MKRLLRLLTAAGIFQALLITLAAIYWLMQPADTNAGWPLQTLLWGGAAQAPVSNGADLPQLAPAVDLPPLRAADVLETSVAATLEHLPADAFHLGPSAVPPSPSHAASQTPTPALTLTAILTPSPSASASAAWTPTSSVTPTQPPSATATLFPTWTRTPVRSPTPSPTPPPSSTPTRTATASHTATSDGPPANTPTATPTPIFTDAPPSATPTTGGPAPTPTVDLSGCNYSSDSAIENQVLALLNQEREAAGLPALAMQSQLRGAAREHSADMACNSFVSHTGSNGTTSYDRITSYGYYPIWWGENIYKGWQTTPEQVVEWWMNSEPHRNNILSSYYVHIGIGYVRVGDYAAYTLNFGRR